MIDSTLNPNANYNAGVAPVPTAAGTFNANNLNPNYTPTTAIGAPTVPSTITSGNLTQQPALNPTIPAAPSAVAFPLSPTAPALTATPTENQATDLITQLQGLNDQNTGQAAYRTTQETAQDIAGKTQTITDLTNHFNELKAQYDQTPLQDQNAVAAGGGGVTAAGLAPKTTAEQRTIAIQSLGTGALLQAAQGNLTTAQSLVDRAVKAKFDPIQEQITAKTNNLNLILNSPAYSDQQKNRAQAQLDNVNAQKAQIDLQTENFKTGQAMVVTASKLYSTDPVAQVAAQQALKLDPTDPQYLEKVTALVGKYQQDPNALALQKAQIGQANASTASSIANTQKTYNDIRIANLGAPGPNGLVQGTTGNAAIDVTKPGYASQIVTGGLTQAAIDQKALSYLTSGTLPPQGRTGISGIQNAAISNRMAEMAPGGNLAGNKAQLKADSSSLTTQQGYLDTTTRAFNTANDTLNALTTFMSQNGINPTQFPDFNSFTNYLKSKGVDPGSAGGYNSQIETLRSEYSQVLAKGGVRSVETDNKAAALIPNGLAPADLAKVAAQIKIDGDNVIRDAQKQVTTIQNRINKTLNSSSGNPKGSQSDASYVQSVLAAQNLNYNAVIAQIPAGQKGVIDNATGQIGSIPPGEYDPSKYTAI